MKQTVLGLLTLMLSVSASHARPCAPPPKPHVSAQSADQEWTALAARGGAMRSNRIPQGQTEKHGHAEILIEAPIELVEQQVRAFGQYRDLAPRRIKTSRIIDKTETSTDVYMQITIMNGFVTIWQVVRFGATQQVTPDTRVIEGNLLKGNVKGSHSTFVLRRVDARRTILKADILSSVEVPVPEEIIDEELRDYAADALAGFRDKAQAAAKALAPSP